MSTTLDVRADAPDAVLPTGTPHAAGSRSGWP